MYTISSKLKTFSIVLMVLGLLGIGYGFLTAPKDIKEVEAILAAQSHGHEGGHAEAPGEANDHGASDSKLDMEDEGHGASAHQPEPAADKAKEPAEAESYPPNPATSDTTVA